MVLPRSAFSAKGSTGFRRWLFGESTVERLDFLLNNRCWIFDTHPQYTVALLVANATPAYDGHEVEMAGVADSERAFFEQSAVKGLSLEATAFGSNLEVPLLPSQAAADLLVRLRTADPFPFGGGRWRCFPVAEFHEKNDKTLWQDATDGQPLWKGESFDQFDPNGAGERKCPRSEDAMKKARKPNPGKDSLVAHEVQKADRPAAVAEQLEQARLAFRDVTNRTNSRTVLACLVPPKTFLTNKAPYLTFVEGEYRERAACLGLMNSLAFDWQARRFVETNVNFFIIEGLRVPELSDEHFEAIAHAAARLSCPDERFNDFAAATGVEVGPLESDESERLRADDRRARRARVGPSTQPISRRSSRTSPSTRSRIATGSVSATGSPSWPRRRDTPRRPRQPS